MKTLPQVLLLDDTDLPTPDLEAAGLGAMRTERGLLPLESVDLLATIDGLTAHLNLTQTFANVHDAFLEATYIFPLPERAAVLRFRLQVGDRITEGELKERGQARREYREAIEQGHQAAITEEERPGTFTMRVGNIPPGERATVHLTLAQPLPCVEGEATFQFPLVVAPRYIPGTPLGRPPVGSGSARDTDATPDASRISPPVLLPGFPNPVALSLEVHFVASDLMPLAVRSSLHTVVEDEEDETGWRIRVLAGERLNRDFILRYRLADRAIRTSLTLHPDADGGGTFALTVLPPYLESQPTRPRDIVFVLDRSGSMSGWKMVTARRAVMQLVESLTDRDRFTVYAFDDRIEPPPPFSGDRLMSANYRRRTEALEFLNGVDHRGGTEMAQPLDLGLSRLLETGTEEGRDKVLVLITDGQVGNENAILKRMGERLKHVRVHALGIDRAVNAGFLRQLADLGGGSSVLVESEERLEEVIDHVQRAIGTPVLTGVQVQGEGLSFEAGSVVPARIPDLFTGTPLVLLGRYDGDGAGAITLSGTSPDGVLWSMRVPAKRVAQPALPALWARQKLRDLEDRYAIASNKELERTIVAVSLRYGVLCKFTSFVAVDRSRVVNVGGKQHKVTQAVELPDGWAGTDQARREAPVLLERLRSMDAEAADSDCLERAPAAGGLRGTPAKRDRAMPRRKVRKAAGGPREPVATPPGLTSPQLVQLFAQLGQQVADGVRALLGAGRSAAANPLNREPFKPEVEALATLLRSTTQHNARLLLLSDLLRRLHDLVLKLLQAGDYSPEMLAFGGTVQTLAELVSHGVPNEPALALAWEQVRDALDRFRAVLEPDAFWK